MTSKITDFRIVEACGFSKVFIKVNGVDFESLPTMGKLDEAEVKGRLGID